MLEVFAQIQEAATKNQPTLRVIDKIEIGQAIRQGDIYVMRIASVPAGRKMTGNKQLAIGQTQGSRHIVAGDAVIWESTGGVLEGPIVSAETGWMITHPEHGHFAMPAGVFQVTYQREYAEELRRVSD